MLVFRHLVLVQTEGSSNVLIPQEQTFRVLRRQTSRQNTSQHTSQLTTPTHRTGKLTAAECIGEMQTGKEWEKSIAGTLHSTRGVEIGPRQVSQTPTTN